MKKSIDFHGRELSLSSGKIAKQADGSVIAQVGETMILATAVARTDKEWQPRDFMPLSVDFIERHLAAGKIPGGFFKREGRPSEREVLTSRLIDRPIRPLFAKDYCSETQVITTVLSIDGVNDADVLAMTAASAALHISDIPLVSAIAGVRVGLLGGRWVVNPSIESYPRLEANLIVACSKEAIVMVEGGALEIAEEKIIDGLLTAFEAAQPLIDLQEQLRKEVGKEKRAVAPANMPEELLQETEQQLLPSLRKALKEVEKLPRKKKIGQAIDQAEKTIMAKEKYAGKDAEFRLAVEGVVKKEMRQMILAKEERVDGRKKTDVRPITVETSLIPRLHGTALFTRGETQALVTTTLGSRDGEQKIDTAYEESYKSFMIHYNFPPYSVNEVKFLRSPGRREIGHGALAERAIKAVMPDQKDFPYTVRVVSDIMESNGSSSMATVCGASLSLMDSGVPLKGPVAGVAMGMVKEGDKSVILTDILGDEDHIGDMDFKVAGSENGISAIQMDIKCDGVTREVLTEALEQARLARLHILKTMNGEISEARKELSPYAPKITSLKINPEKIKDLIGPGGKHIKGIVEQTGAKIDVEDDGMVNIACVDQEMGAKALELVNGYTAEPEVGKIYEGKVERIADFGAFVEIMPNVVGLCHISQLEHRRVEKVRDVLKEGDTVKVKVLEVEGNGKIRLSRKAALEEE